MIDIYPVNMCICVLAVLSTGSVLTKGVRSVALSVSSESSKVYPYTMRHI